MTRDSRQRALTARAKDPLGAGRWPWPARIAAIALTAACAIPAILWGIAYPPEALAYWTAGSILLSIVALLRLLAPRHFVATLQHLLRFLRWPSPAAFAATTGIAVFAMALFMAFYAFHGRASTTDEAAMLWHAEILLDGKLSLPVDPNREFFALETIVDTGRWYSQFPIGGPVILAIGQSVDAPWIVNPLLAAVAVVAFYAFSRLTFGEQQGRTASVVFALAPMLVLMAGTLMSHTAVLALWCLTLCAIARWHYSNGLHAHFFAAIVGFCVGAMAAIRPLDAIAAALAVGAFQIWLVWSTRRRWVELVTQLAAGIVVLASLLYVNAANSGNPFRFGYDVNYGPAHRVGFHLDPYGDEHTLGRGVEQVAIYIDKLNLALLAWPAPAIVLVVVGFAVMRSFTRWDALLLGHLAAQCAAYIAYWGEGEFLGPRFLFTAIPTLIAVIARLPLLLIERRRAWGEIAAAFVILCVTASWFVPAPYSSIFLARQARQARGLLKMDVDSAVQSANVGPAVVFLREAFASRLARRLWALGMLRGDAAQLIAAADICSLHAAIRFVEQDTALDPRQRAYTVIARTVRFSPGPRSRQFGDPSVNISDVASIPSACQRELEEDARIGVAAFGAAMPLQRYDSLGRLGGPIIYAADLGDRNEVLRERFRDRGWYRLQASRGPSGVLIPIVTPY